MTDLAATATVEHTSGKGAGDENFPVGSRLLPARLRPHVMAFYAFARAADDIADAPDIAPDDKLARLDALRAGLVGEGTGPAVAKAERLRHSLAETGVTARHALDLLAAFRQDAVKNRYDDWDDLMAYCALSAHPVGRYLVDLHGGPETAYPASDALCAALQVLNHLQDCAGDYRRLDRVYLPLDWLAEAGTSVEALTEPAAGPGLRCVLDRCLDGTAALLSTSRPLSARVTSRRLALEAAAIQRLAVALARRLRREDPLAGRVALSKPAMVAVAFGGCVTALPHLLSGNRRGEPANAIG